MASTSIAPQGTSKGVGMLDISHTFLDGHLEILDTAGSTIESSGPKESK